MPPGISNVRKYDSKISTELASILFCFHILILLAEIGCDQLTGCQIVHNALVSVVGTDWEFRNGISKTEMIR